MFDNAAATFNSGTAALGNVVSSVTKTASGGGNSLGGTDPSNPQSSSMWSLFKSKVVPPSPEESAALQSAYDAINKQDRAQVNNATKCLKSSLKTGPFGLWGGKSRRKSRIRKGRKTKFNVAKRSHRVLHHKR